MANTFKFGNGNWAVKDGYALAYNDENNNFKPLPFDFTRASSATRLNKQGLIETVGSGKPRIDFTDNTSGHLLLEPSRTNIVFYSEQLDNSVWNKLTNTTVTANQIVSPDGSQNADEFSATSTSTSLMAVQDSFSVSSSVDYVISFFAKKGSVRYVQLFNGTGQVTGNPRTNFDLQDGNVAIQDGGHTSSIEDFGNGWYRCTTKVTTLSTTLQMYINGVSTSTASRSATSSWTSGDNFYVWGAQLEQGSYATSYIPTEGSSVTRVVDDIELVLPDVDSFNSSSGFSVIAKFDIGETSGSSSVPFLFFKDDTSNTYMGFGSNTTNLRCRLNLSGTSYLNTQSNAPRTQRNSLFISCDSSGWSQGANGSTNHTGTNNASIFNRLASITFITSETYGIIKISELLVYNTRLSNTELQNLTS